MVELVAVALGCGGEFFFDLGAAVGLKTINARNSVLRRYLASVRSASAGWRFFADVD